MSPFQIADNIVDRVVVRFATIFYFFLDDKKFSTFLFIPERESFFITSKAELNVLFFPASASKRVSERTD